MHKPVFRYNQLIGEQTSHSQDFSQPESNDDAQVEPPHLGHAAQHQVISA
jgi:hypothetical protein